MSTDGSTRSMNVPTKFAVFAPLFPPATLGGGPIRTLKALVDSVPTNTQAFVFTSDRDMGQSIPLPVRSNEWSASDGVQVYYGTASSFSSYLRGLCAVRQERPQVTYYNSFFNPGFSLFPQILGLIGFWRGAQILLAPRGEFGRGALAIRPLKKRIAVAVYKMLGLHRGISWHASSLNEAEDIRAVFGETARVLVREDETALPIVAERPPSARARSSLRIVFVSRLNPMKGLDLLLRSLMLTQSKITLDVYGNAEDLKYVQDCQDLIKELPVNILCTLHGSIAPECVRGIFAEGDVFVFPTAGENFGHVIAEALSVSCPVMCSDVTPWSDVLRNAGCEVLGSRDPHEWSIAIESFAALSPDEVHERRRAAGAAFDCWSQGDKGEHVFALLARSAFV
ncbi:glycosyltransferase [Cryobacterium sp. TMT2-10]|uniref:glycosyltransferase n=1 Tax=Cryobacterium sp. TMT2-10 TaxID=1259244 RepID=UPI00106A53D4|nr:glycosyltransferase [Cryobacterium sp. TMT2-10]TFD40338.1 glycosyltransferase [Cryobacterium sp. TMT2-10]